MMAYMRRLRALDPARGMFHPAPRAIMLLTGRSVFDDCQLRPQQVAFLEQVAPPGVQVIHAHFPYHPDLMVVAPREPNVLICSWRNVLQYAWARSAPSFRRIVARHLQGIFEACDRVTIITGSCGLALLESAREHLTLRSENQLKVIALGPVIWFRPAMRHLTVVRGRRDWISRSLAPIASDYLVEGEHMDYYANSRVARVVQAICEQHFAS